MDFTQLVVTAVGLALVTGILLFFFGPRKAVAARAAASGVQEVDILVQGGYSPAVVQAKRGQPLRLRFNRQETAACSDVVVFPDFGVRRDLPAFRTTIVELVPDRNGEFTFVCGMNMLRGTLVVTDN
ncbi:MAG TPA: cupredoxin domain-containing protein [Vicinamibacterales bacterium]|jgi:plastocyanin domain-containing protein